MSKVRRIEITIETHEITRIHKGRNRSGADRMRATPEQNPDGWTEPIISAGPDLILFSESSPEIEVSNPAPLAVDESSHIPGKTLNG